MIKRRPQMNAAFIFEKRRPRISATPISMWRRLLGKIPWLMNNDFLTGNQYEYTMIFEESLQNLFMTEIHIFHSHSIIMMVRASL